MASVLDQPLDEFKSDLVRLDQLLTMLTSLRDFGSIDIQEGDAKTAFVTSAITIRDGIRKHKADIPVLSGSLLLYLSGRFEHFVRMIFQALCDGYASKCSTFEELPKKMQKSLHWYTTEVARDYSKYGYDEIAAFGFLASYVENCNTSGPLVVNSACLSVTQSNMRPEVIADIFKRIGVDQLWVEMSKQSVLKAFFETDKDNFTEKEAKAMLEELMTSRNGIAHPTSTPNFPDLERIKKFLEFISVLSSALHLASVTSLAAFRPLKVADGT